jgi:hypothetical protein
VTIEAILTSRSRDNDVSGYVHCTFSFAAVRIARLDSLAAGNQEKQYWLAD